VIQRPPFPRIVPGSPLAGGLMFAALGGGAGTVTAFDASGHGNHGTLTNMNPATDWVDVLEFGRKAIELDGSNDYVLSGYTPPVLTELSVFAWVKTSSAGSGGDADYLFDTSNGSAGFMIRTGASSKWACYAYGNSDLVDDIAVGVYNDSLWHHIGFTFRGPDFKTYFDGQLSLRTYTPSTTVLSGGVPVSIGAEYDGTDNLPGSVADPMIWNRVLSPSEIAALADPSNTLLEVGNSPLIWTPRLRTYFYAKASGGAPPAGTPWLYRPINSQTIGVCA